MSPAGHNEISDAQLVAYLDGELSTAETEAVAKALSQSAGTRERLETMKLGGRAFPEAFDLLLDAAPNAKLQAMFADLIANEAAPSGAASRGGNILPFGKRGAPLWRFAAAAAILALVFTGGLFAGGLFNAPENIAERELSWREEAAGYIALFSKDTLAGMPTDNATRQLNLSRVATALGLDLSGEKIANPALSFQGTQLLQFEGRPLAQIAYLYGNDTPVALCIIKSSNPPRPPAEEKRYGLNSVHWVKGGYGFVVLGKVPEPELRRISETFRARLS